MRELIYCAVRWTYLQTSLLIFNQKRFILRNIKSQYSSDSKKKDILRTVYEHNIDKYDNTVHTYQKL